MGPEQNRSALQALGFVAVSLIVIVGDLLFAHFLPQWSLVPILWTALFLVVLAFVTLRKPL
jgi:hypothetical protein